MNNIQKRALAALLLNEAGGIIEFYSEKSEDYPPLRGVTAAEAAEQLSKWLSHLPGDVWNSNLPLPK